MAELIAAARSRAERIADGLPHEALVVRGIWLCQYSVKLTDNSSTLNLQYLVVQGERQGCCYFDGPALGALGPALIGRELLTLRETRALEVAALDAVLLADPDVPRTERTITGSPMEKAEQRAAFVLDQVRVVLSGLEAGARVLVVGVVGDFLAALKPLVGDVVGDVVATDFSPGVVGRRLHGVEVLDGSRTLEQVARSQVALVTGMTLGNGTLESILAVARRHGTRVVMYCQTGAGFGPVLREAGVACVVGEPHPFYLTADGPTTLRVY